jgi:ABC-type Fe3+-hydroxamate transport system substrate-binding protein
MHTTDQTGRTFEMSSTPRRIVSLVPSQTELLHTLGLEEEVVGITRFCIHPEEWRRTKTRVGGTKDADVERIRSLQPDIVIANKEENRRETVSEIASFCPVWTSDVSDIPGALDMIRSLGVLLGRASEADSLVERLHPLSSLRLGNGNLRAAYLIWKDPWMTVGGDTFIHDMMRCAGLSNVFGDRTRYPETGIDEIASLKPDVLLLSSEPYPFRERHAGELKNALPFTEVMLVDGEMFSWYGSRMLKGMDYLRRLRVNLHASGKD